MRWVIVGLGVVVGACSDTNGGNGSATEQARRSLLAAAGECALSSAEEFRLAANALEGFVTAYVADPIPQRRAVAQEGYKLALDVWQRNEPFQFGPAATSVSPGGQDLRDSIYAWPLVSRCAVEEQILSQGYAAPGFRDTLVTRRGLGALEYLLFFTGTDTACPAGSATAIGWGAMTDNERETRKRAYAMVVATDVRARAEALVEAWTPLGGNFLRQLREPGSAGAVYASSQAALNAVSDAAFYIELTTKDAKLARPLGLRDCATATCIEAVESPFALRSKVNVRENIRGFRKLMEGCSNTFQGTGFDDLLSAVGATSAADALVAANTAMGAALEAVDEADLALGITNNLPSVRAVYDAIKATTDLLKTQVLSVLDLELPALVEGDND
ncbi:MAG: imelysin family protein [Myxococcaceae bacterium]